MLALTPLHPQFPDQPLLSPTRVGFGHGLLALGQTNPEVMVLTADLADSTKVAEFRDAYPERFVECGVAEQNMIGIAAGLALSGFTPFASSYATFSPGRSWDQVRVSVCYTGANVKIVGAHAGLSVGPDGATHQALEDIAITRVLPGLTVVVPCDAEQAKLATIAIGQMIGPAYLRLTRENTPVITTADSGFTIGQSQLLKSGTDVVIIGCGPILAEALLAAEALAEKGLSVAVLNCHTIKPIDAASIIELAQLTSAIVTVEEHQITGGLGGAVAEVLSEHYPVPMERVGMRDTFGESGQPAELFHKYGLDQFAIAQAVEKVLIRKLNHV